MQLPPREHLLIRARRGRPVRVPTACLTAAVIAPVPDAPALATLLVLAVAIAAAFALEFRRRGSAGRQITPRTAGAAVPGAREALFRALIENTFDIVVVLDAGGTFRYVSPSVRHLLGYEATEQVERSGFELVHPEDAAAAVAAFTHAVEGRTTTSSSLEVRLRHRDGSWRRFEARALNRLEDPALAGVVIHLRDVTTQREGEEQTARLAAIVEATPDFVGTFDSHGRALHINRAGRRIAGLSDEAVRTATISDFYPHEAAGLILREAIPAARRDQVWAGETSLLAADGSVVPVSQVIVAHRDRDGSNAYLSAIARDISERARAEEALRRSEEQYRYFFEQNPLPMLVFDRQTFEILTVNEAAVAHYGYTRAEFQSMSIEALRPPEDVPAFRAISREGESRHHAIYRHRKKNGEIIQVEIAARDLSYASRPSTLVLISDVTARAHAEQALLRSQEQLRHAHKMEAVGQLAGGIAHDFNNLMTAISGNAQLLLLDPDLAGAHEDLEQIRAAARRAATLTQQLLAFSRQQTLQPRVLSPTAVIREIEPMLRRLTGNEIRVRMDVPADLDRIEADPGQLQQVLLNLAVNARDAMPNGGELRVHAGMRELGIETAEEMVLAPGRYLLLSIRDTGSGMDARTQARIFEPFFTTKEERTGLGLSTVYGIVEQSGGAIRVLSEPGRGTEFEIFLPTVDAATEENATREVAGAGPRESTTIVIVDDEDAIRRFAASVLRNAGYGLIEAGNGEDAVQALAASADPPDLLLTDVFLPGMNGHELAAHLRSAYPGLRTLFMSGYVDHAFLPEAQCAEGARFLQKPFDTDDLLAAVRELLGSAPHA